MGGVASAGTGTSGTNNTQHGEDFQEEFEEDLADRSPSNASQTSLGGPLRDSASELPDERKAGKGNEDTCMGFMLFPAHSSPCMDSFDRVGERASSYGPHYLCPGRPDKVADSPTFFCSRDVVRTGCYFVDEGRGPPKSGRVVSRARSFCDTQLHCTSNISLAASHVRDLKQCTC